MRIRPVDIILSPSRQLAAHWTLQSCHRATLRTHRGSTVHSTLPILEMHPRMTGDLTRRYRSRKNGNQQGLRTLCLFPTFSQAMLLSLRRRHQEQCPPRSTFRGNLTHRTETPVPLQPRKKFLAKKLRRQMRMAARRGNLPNPKPTLPPWLKFLSIISTIIKLV